MADDDNPQKKTLVTKEYPIHYSNVSHIDPQSGKPTKVKYKYLEDGTKVRISKASGAIIPKPDNEELKYVNRTRDRKLGPFDTPADKVLEKTYKGEDFGRVYAEFEQFLKLKQEKEQLMVFKE